MSKKLTRELIIQKVHSDRFVSIKNLNLWGSNIDDVSILKELPNLEIVIKCKSYTFIKTVF